MDVILKIQRKVLVKIAPTMMILEKKIADINEGINYHK
jgi:hypothetical protein